MAEQKKPTFKRLHELGPDLVSQVDQRLLNGEKCSSVAEWLQKELQVLTDLQPSSLKKNLERYRAADLKDRVVEELVEKLPVNGGMGKALLAIDEMERLLLIQRGRVEKMLIREKMMPDGLVLNQTKDEIRLLKDLAVELGKLQLETGVMRRAPKTLSGTVTDPTTGEVKEFTWKEEQDALFKRLETLELTAEDLEPTNG